MRASAHRQLSLFPRARPPVASSARDIVDAIALTVAEHYGADIRTLRSSTRRQPFAQLRMVVMYVAATVGGLGPSATGSALGRDHSTVIHGVDEIKTALEIDPFLRRSVADVTEKARLSLVQLAAG